jgi:uncharacterized protein YciI
VSSIFFTYDGRSTVLYRYHLATLVAVLGFVHLGASLLAAQEREGVPAAPAAAPLPMPQAWDTSYVVLLETNADYRPSSQEAIQATLQGHLQYQLRLIAEGHTVMGGPLVPAEGAPLVGMTVLRAASAAEAQAIANADPGVAAGMMRASVRTWTTPAGGAARRAAPATARDSVVAVVDEVLRAMASNDVETSRRVLLPGGVGFSTRQTPEGMHIRRESNGEYLEWLAQNADVMVERMWNHSVAVHGAIATLWAPYDFYVNHTFSHCGVNAVQLIRTADGWRVANWIWTVEPEGCAPSPLGPLRQDQR